MKVVIRKLTQDDMIASARLVTKTTNRLRLDSGLPRLPIQPVRKKPPLMCHLIETDPNGSYGAFIGDGMIGYSSAFIRDGQWYLAFLFVDPKFQGQGLGQKLLRKALTITKGQQIHTHSLCTFSYNPRAVALYSSFGFYPLQAFPMMIWHPGKTKKIRNEYDFRTAPIEDYKQIEILNGLDKIHRGIYRPEEHKFWIDLESITGYLFYHGKKVVGYSYITRKEVIAPVCAESPQFLKPLLIATLNIALKESPEKLILWVPGTNGDILQYVLKLGFRIDEVDLLMSDRIFYRDKSYIPATLAVF